MIKYSVITPVYNRAGCIKRCLESVTRNVGCRDDVEHIVVDDGSSDSTPAIIKEYSERYSHVQRILFPHNRGTNAARNSAIAAAKGHFCIILDSDDYWDEKALTIIDDTVSRHPEIRHFCFAPDDMQESYDKNPLLAGKSERHISFEDFLLGRVSGDFVHVMSMDIVKRHPFDENLRIYEGVFFLSFYKEAKSILFINKVVSHRERGRRDSVTREMIRTNKKSIIRTIKANELFIDRYANDLIKSEEGKITLYNSQLALLDNYLLVGDYKKTKKLIDEMKQNCQFTLFSIFKYIYKMRLGWLYYLLLNLYLRIKYDLLLVKWK